MKIKIYSFVRKIDTDRFDYHYIRNVISALELKGYEIQWENLDGSCSIAKEIKAAEHTTTSVLTHAKNSSVAGQLRECAYSVLEVLGLD